MITESSLRYVGIPYKSGGDSETEGFDCWTFVKHFLKNEFDILLDYSPTREQIESYKDAARWISSGVEKELKQKCSVEECELSDLQHGGIVLMGKGSYVTHIGVYIGGGYVIHCQDSKTGGQVVIWPLRVVKKNYINLQGYNHVLSAKP